MGCCEIITDSDLILLKVILRNSSEVIFCSSDQERKEVGLHIGYVEKIYGKEEGVACIGYIEDIWIYGCEIFCGKGDRVSYRIYGKDMETRRRVAHIGYREKIYGKCRSKRFMKIICGKGAGVTYTIL